jgi:hypothetical protein
MKHDKKPTKKDKDKLKTKSKGKAPAGTELSEDQLEHVAGGALNAYQTQGGTLDVVNEKLGTAITITGTMYKE